MRNRQLVGDPGNAAAQDFADHGGKVAGTLDTIISKLVRREPLRVERAKAGFVAEQWPSRHGHATRQQNFDRSIDPDDRYAGVARKFRRPGLCVRASPQRQNRGLHALDGAAQGATQLIGFQLAKRGLPVAFKKFRYRNPGHLFDFFIEVHEAPAELFCEAGAYRAFAGTHETGEAENRCAWWRTASD